MAGSRDSVVTGLIGAKRIADMEPVLPNLRQKFIIEGAGYWVQQEPAREVNAALIAFLRENAGEVRVRPGSIKPASGQQFTRSARIDRRIGRNGTDARFVTLVIFVSDGAWIIQDPAARTR
jgi:hypothetical protein